nr:histidine kinase dimerization/phospho-acceptor domain-containing protein [Sphingomonas sp. BK481]
MPDLVPADQAQSLRKFMRRALEGESFVIKAAFGDPARCQPTWSVTYNPLCDESGAIVGAFHHAVDISSQVRAETELAETQEVLRQCQKMEAVGQLTGGIAHDFNNLLTVIRGSVDLLRRDSLTPERRGRYIDAIGDTAERAAKLTSQLLSFARRQALRQVTTELDNLYQNLLAGLATPALRAMIAEREAEKVLLETRAGAVADSKPTAILLPHPVLVEQFRRKVASLRQSLDDASIRTEAAAVLSTLIESVTIFPDEPGGPEAEVVAKVSDLLTWATNDNAAREGGGCGSMSVVAGTGFEPVTFRL